MWRRFLRAMPEFFTLGDRPIYNTRQSLGKAMLNYLHDMFEGDAIKEVVALLKIRQGDARVGKHALIIYAKCIALLRLSMVLQKKATKDLNDVIQEIKAEVLQFIRNYFISIIACRNKEYVAYSAAIGGKGFSALGKDAYKPETDPCNVAKLYRLENGEIIETATANLYGKFKKVLEAEFSKIIAEYNREVFQGNTGLFYKSAQHIAVAESKKIEPTVV